MKLGVVSKKNLSICPIKSTRDLVHAQDNDYRGACSIKHTSLYIKHKDVFAEAKQAYIKTPLSL